MAFCFKQCALTLVSALPLVLALAIYWTPSLFNEWEALFGYGNVQRYEVPPKLMQQFRMFDSNGDGYIDPYEYMALHNYLKTEVGDLCTNRTHVHTCTYTPACTCMHTRTHQTHTLIIDKPEVYYSRKPDPW